MRSLLTRPDLIFFQQTRSQDTDFTNIHACNLRVWSISAKSVLYPVSKLRTWSTAIWRNSPRKYGVAIGQYQEHWLHSPCRLTWRGLRSTQTDGSRDRTFPSYLVPVFQNNSSSKSLTLHEFDTHESELVDVTHFNMVSQVDSISHRGKRQLGNVLLESSFL